LLRDDGESVFCSLTKSDQGLYKCDDFTDAIRERIIYKMAINEAMASSSEMKFGLGQLKAVPAIHGRPLQSVAFSGENDCSRGEVFAKFQTQRTSQKRRHYTGKKCQRWTAFEYFNMRTVPKKKTKKTRPYKNHSDEKASIHPSGKRRERGSRGTTKEETVDPLPQQLKPSFFSFDPGLRTELRGSPASGPGLLRKLAQTNLKEKEDAVESRQEKNSSFWTKGA